MNTGSFIYQNLETIPSNWEISRYKYHIKIKNGFPFKSDFFDLDEGFPLIRIRDIKSGKIKTFYKGHFSEEFIIKKDDLIIGMDGDFNLRWWEGPDALLNQKCCQILECKTFDLRFLYYLLPHQLKIINDITYFTTVKHLSIFDIYEQSVLIPPINEQKLISQYLDKKTQIIDSLIEKIEIKVELLKEQKTALINQYVTKGLDPNLEMTDSGVEWIGEIPKKWIFGKLRWFINDIKDGTHGSYASEEEGELLLSGKNVDNGFLKIKDNERRISKESHLEITKNGFPKKGDVLVSCVGSIGRSCVYELDETISFQRSVCFIRPSEKLNSYFLSYLVRSRTCQEQLITLTNQSTVGGVYMSDIQDLLITIPPLEEQKNIVKLLNLKFDDINLLINKNTKKIELLKEYRQSLIFSVVTGKIRITQDMI